MTNLFDLLPADAAAEIATDLLTRLGARIERIVLTGQSISVARRGCGRMARGSASCSQGTTC